MLLVARREVPRDVHLAHGLAERSLDERHPALPPFAQLLRARLQVNQLHIGQVTWLRQGVTPPPAPGLPTPEARPFTVPELPVAVRLEDLALERLIFDEAVFGMAAELTAGGSLVLEGGNLDANLDISRLDGPGGRLVAAVDYRREGKTIDLGITLTEPDDGIVANLLNIPERPPIAFSVTGAGPVADLTTEMTLDAGEIRALSGVATIAQAPEGFRIAADLQERTGLECRAVVPGHIQRGGSPSPYDRVLATRLGVRAAELIRDGKYGVTVGVSGQEIVDNPLDEVAGKTKFVPVDHQLVRSARNIGIVLGD